MMMKMLMVIMHTGFSVTSYSGNRASCLCMGLIVLMLFSVVILLISAVLIIRVAVSVVGSMGWQYWACN